MKATTYLILSVLVMAAVTYLPRTLPLLLLRKALKNRWLISFLRYIPYAVLSAMTIPAVLSSTAMWPSAAAGTIAALLLSLRGKSLLWVALGASGTVLFVEQLLLLLMRA